MGDNFGSQNSQQQTKDDSRGDNGGNTNNTLTNSSDGDNPQEKGVKYWKKYWKPGDDGYETLYEAWWNYYYLYTKSFTDWKKINLERGVDFEKLVRNKKGYYEIWFPNTYSYDKYSLDGIIDYKTPNGVVKKQLRDTPYGQWLWEQRDDAHKGLEDFYPVNGYKSIDYVSLQPARRPKAFRPGGGKWGGYGTDRKWFNLTISSQAFHYDVAYGTWRD